MAAILTITMISFIVFAVPTFLIVKSINGPEKSRKDRLLELDRDIEYRENRIRHLAQRESDLQQSVDFLNELKKSSRFEDLEYEPEHRLI